MKYLLFWLQTILVFFMFIRAGFSCTPDDINWNLESAISEYFISCQRPPLEDEKILFTWGHKEKLARLQADGYGLFAQYNKAQQYAYAGIQARSDLKGYIDYPLFGKYVDRLKQSYGLMNVGELYDHSTKLESLSRIEKLWNNVTHDGTLPRPEIPHQSPAKAGLMALALDQVNPGFIEDLPYSIDQLIEKTKNRLENDGSLDGPTRRRLEGRLLGYTRAKQNPDSGGKRSNISYGPAVYLAAGPADFVEHYYDDNHTGIACLVQATDRITDLTGSKNTLLEKGIYLSTATTPPQPIMYPGGYNELSDPYGFRLAMQGRILKRDKNYADSGVIRYDLNGVCRDIQLDDFRDCDAVVKLLKIGKFYGGTLYNFLVTDDEANQVARFNRRIEKCAVSAAVVKSRADEKLLALPNSCVYLQDEWFQQAAYYKKNKEFIDNVIAKHCN